MKILVTSIVDLKSSQHNRLHEFIEYLSKKNDVTVLSINDWWKKGQNDLEACNSHFDDILKRVQYHYLTDRKISPILQELLFQKKAESFLGEGFDIHLNYNSLIMGCKLSKKMRTVLDLADDLVTMIRYSPQIPAIWRPVGSYVSRLLLNKSIERAEKVTLTTYELKGTFNIPDEKIRIIPNGVDLDLFRNYGDIKEELGFEGFIIGYVGVLREWVDLEPVFKAIKEMSKDIKLVIIGKEGRYKENVKLAETYRVSDRVIFKGTILYSQVPKYISAMDVCLIPFKQNSISQNALPLKLFEYMACGKPVICTPIRAIRKIVGNRVLYMEDSEQLMRLITILYKNRPLLKYLGRQGREFVELNYSWQVICRELEKIMSTIVN